MRNCPWKREMALFMAVVMILPVVFSASAYGYCNLGAAVPAFLATSSVPPNLLIMIDNSGSAYDLAYLDPDETSCYDDSYSSAATYAGYFDGDTWYEYDLTDQRFEPRTLTAFQEAAMLSLATYHSPGNDVVISIDSTPAVTQFAAKGDFLNWAASSKMDVQKEILTGGKYDSTNHRLIMENRGCLNGRFIKQIEMRNSANSVFYLPLGVRAPELPQYPAWETAKAYATGDVVSWGGSLYQVTSAGTSTGSNLLTDTGPTWAPYYLHEWHAGTTYPAGSIVMDPSKANTYDEGTLYITPGGGTAAVTATGIDDDTGITDWEPYYLTQIEIFPVTATGFDNSACQDAVDEMSYSYDGDSSTSTSQGDLKQDIEDCMGYSSGVNQGSVSNYMAAFNHSVHNCWYDAKHGSWPSGSGPVQSIKPACEALYTASPPIQPWEITVDSRGYACYGLYYDDGTTVYQDGYVGRCWEAASMSCTCANNRLLSSYSGAAADCTPDYHYNDTACCDVDKNNAWNCAGTGGSWVAGGYADSDTCIEAALQDYCGSLEIPEVIDPTDQSTPTNTVWNLPAVLVDSGVIGQMGEPLATMNGYLYQSSAPEGLIQEYDDDIRMGAMIFNTDGSADERDATSSAYSPFFTGTVANNRDGGRVISYIDQSAAHTDTLVAAINDIKANTWTPLAESMFNAIGYYTQDSTRRLDANDFTIDASHDPVTAWCQSNNIMIITEGASTADKNETMATFVQTNHDGDTDGTTCDPDTTDSEDPSMAASTYFDDLVYFAKHASGIFASEPNSGDDPPHYKQNINTHIVVSGSTRHYDGVTGECDPGTLMTSAATNSDLTVYQANNPAELKTKVAEAFEAIRAGMAAGSAASVISASRGGEGAIYQAIFWPSVEVSATQSVDWTGEVHALLIDDMGLMYEDTNGDRTLNPCTTYGDSNCDNRLIVFFDEADNRTKACYGGDLTADGTNCTGTEKEIDEVQYMWSAAEWLAGISDTDILSNRSTYISSSQSRYIFTWEDLDNEGDVDWTDTDGDGIQDPGEGEVIAFDPTLDWAGMLTYPASPVAGDRGPVPLDFGVQTSAEVNDVVKWVRGLDQTGQRSRGMDRPGNFDSSLPNTITWRLGDVVHSTPIAVSRPSEGFQFIYNDMSYADFAALYKDRRHMVYFGGNDGMLHAVNGGFYNTEQGRFCRTDDCTDENATPTSSPELGAEMWAYVPYNLLPHLKCLTENSYTHKYYVDLRPRIFDVQIFFDGSGNAIDTDHPHGWGTILVCGMRLGGAAVEPGTLDLDGDSSPDYSTDQRVLKSAYMIFDITNPEKPPQLLGELTYDPGTSADMAYTATIPTLTVMKDSVSGTNEWNLILGSGPTDVDGSSTQAPKIGVFPLSRLVGTTKQPFQIPSAAPTSGDESGSLALSASGNGFVSDLITVDFDVDENYMSDAVYFGTVEGSTGSWSGRMYRLVTQKLNAAGEQIPSIPGEWPALLSASSLSNPLPLFNAEQPVSGPPTVGTDGTNFWVYFGTGRFMNTDDKNDADQQSFYGIKEPQAWAVSGTECKASFTWETVEKAYSANAPGSLGLTQVDQILVQSAVTADASQLTCRDGSQTCLPLVSGVPVDTFTELKNYINGFPTCGSSDYGTDGWYRDFLMDRERNLGQSTLLGGLLTFTTYQPYDDVCLPEGLSFLYGVYFRTGTAWYEPIFNGGTLTENGNVVEKIELGRGQAITPNVHKGRQEGKTDFIQTSTGTIVEVPQVNLPEQGLASGRSSWRECEECGN